ncbi:MAG: hypothetical protein LBK53_08210 [Heliobacteriaceae bacterium]|jgi:hypothetical protein|nr:hypothetical protein [Heliobacteriaceae bacterium]
MKKFILKSMILFICLAAFIPSAGAYSVYQRRSTMLHSTPGGLHENLFNIVKRYDNRCGYMDIENKEISHYYRNGKWQEIWNLNFCGKKFRVPIDFAYDENRIVHFEVHNNKVTRSYTTYAEYHYPRIINF